MMVKVLVYGYATGCFSPRKIERRLHKDLAFRMLGAGNLPKHRTIRDFRAPHLKELSDLFVQVVKLAREMELIKPGTVAIDGTKIKANASRHKSMSYERMQQAEGQLKAQIDALLERAKTTDAAEADEPELDIPAKIERREVRLKAIAQIEPDTHPHTVAMATKLQTDQGRAAYRRRKWIADPPNGWIKSVLGFRQFSLRGLHRVQAESKLVCLALNLRRMGAMQVA